MNLPFKIARRYLFAKKTTNAINIITLISVIGIAIQAAAFVIVIAVFNGLEDLVLQLFNNFNPELKITPTTGKTFALDSITLAEINAIEGVEAATRTLEEIAVFEYRENQDIGRIKGVDANFTSVTSIDSVMREGSFATELVGRNFAVLGAGLRDRLRVDIGDDFTNLKVYMPKKKTRSALDKPFKEMFLYPISVFSFQKDFDDQYILTNLRFVQRLLEVSNPNEITALELKLTSNADKNKIKKQLQGLLGEQFYVKNRYEQEEAFLKLMNLEKWMGFAILSLTLLLLSFNMIGALWMIVLEKKKDIAILKSMGIQDQAIQKVFLLEGLLISVIGMLIGFVLAIGFYALQKEFGLIKFPGSNLVSAYPMSLRISDLFATTLVILVVGLIASLPAAYRAKKVSAMPKEE